MNELQLIQSKIYNVNGYKVLLDFDLSALYEVENRILKQAVRRNLKRFPPDFMFQLSKYEWKELITNCDNLPDKVKYSPVAPFAFTEQGVAMLSSVLNSDKAIEVNIVIMRAFVTLRRHLTDYAGLKERVARLEKEMNLKFKDLYQALNHLLKKEKAIVDRQKRARIGYKTGNKRK
ncbi:MAG: ORF6N domain-containing protein [Flavobacteriales bacterium]